MEEKILDLAIQALYLKAWVTYLMSNSLNRLQHAGRPDPFFVLGESNRLPREGVDRCNGSAAAWSDRYAFLSSALRESNLASGAEERSKLVCVGKSMRYDFKKAFFPSPRRALGPQPCDDAVRG